MDKRKTIFSECRKYRYTLWREWPDDMFDRHDNYLMVIGLNPSTADETQDDPTIRRCIGFAKRWGFGALCMTNLFAWRDTSPKAMKVATDPVGVMNDHWLSEYAKGAGFILAAWGNHGSHLGRADVVTKLIPNLHCLGKNKDGSPKHPLYLSSSATRLSYG